MAISFSNMVLSSLIVCSLDLLSSGFHRFIFTDSNLCNRLIGCKCIVEVVKLLVEIGLNCQL